MSRPRSDSGDGVSLGPFSHCRLWRVIDGGELDGFVGVFEDLLDADLNPAEKEEDVKFMLLYFPTSRKQQIAHGLLEVNDFFVGTLEYLGENRHRICFDVSGEEVGVEEFYIEE